MMKKLILLCLLGFSSVAMATQCPPAASLTHAGSGADWVLDPLVAEQGWYISNMSPAAVTSSEVQLSPDASFAAYLYSHGDFLPSAGDVACNYGDDGYDYFPASSSMLQLAHRGDLFSFDEKILQRFDKKYYAPSISGADVSFNAMPYYRCRTTVASEADCAW